MSPGDDGLTVIQKLQGISHLVSAQVIAEYLGLALHESVCVTDFSPGSFLVGAGFGIPAGFLEEIGWTGYAFPKMCRKLNPFTAGILLGLLWGLWHFPVIDFLGTTTPHGKYLVPYFLTFITAMTTMRVLIGWMYVNTHSVTIAQLMHVSSTGSLVVFSPPRVNAAQEALWNGVYVAALWITLSIVAIFYGKPLPRKRA